MLLGNQTESHPDGALLRALARYIARAAEVSLGYLPSAANSVGGWLAGALPQRLPGGKPAEQVGLDARAMLEQPRKAYLLLGTEPELDAWDGAAALAALDQAEFVVSITPFVGPAVKDYADVILPCAAFSENDASYVNAEGRWQSFTAACRPLGEARPAWKVLRVLGNLFELNGFDYVDSRQILAELQTACGELRPDNFIDADIDFERRVGGDTGNPLRIGELAPYAADPLVRRAPALGQTPVAEAYRSQLRVNPALAERLQLDASATVAYNAAELTLPVVQDSAVPDGCVWLPQGHPEITTLGPAVGPLTVKPAAR